MYVKMLLPRVRSKNRRNRLGKAQRANDKYCVSISGLFKNIETDEVLLETALSKKLSIDFDKISACTSLRILSEKIESVITDLIRTFSYKDRDEMLYINKELLENKLNNLDAG